MNKKKDFGAGPEWFFLAALLAPSALQSSRPLGKKIAQAMVNLGELLQEAIDEQELRELEELDDVEETVAGAPAAAPAPKRASTEPVKETVIRSAPEPEVARTTEVSSPPTPAPAAPAPPKVAASTQKPPTEPVQPIVAPAAAEASTTSFPATKIAEPVKPEAPEPKIEVAAAEATAPTAKSPESDKAIRWKSDDGSASVTAASSGYQEEFIEEVITSVKPTTDAERPKLTVETATNPAPPVTPPIIPTVSVPASLRAHESPMKPARTLADILQQSAAKAQDAVPQMLTPQTNSAPEVSEPVTATELPTPSPIPAPVLTAMDNPITAPAAVPPVEPVAESAPAPAPTPVAAPKPKIEVPVIPPIPAAALPPAPGVELPKQVESVDELLAHVEKKPATQVGEWDFAIERNRARAEGVEPNAAPVEAQEMDNDAEETAVSERRGFAFFPESAEAEESSVATPRNTERKIMKAGFRSRLESKMRRPAPKPKMVGPRPHATAPTTPSAPEVVAPRTSGRNRFTVPDDLEVG